MAQANSFPPQWRTDARVLVLGSMPGVASLTAQRYYAHPRNAFWPIMGQLLGFDPALSYEARLEALKAGRVALWDVIGRCYRPGSLDSQIDPASIEPNDLAALMAKLPELRLIAFNGGTAARLYRQHWASHIVESCADRSLTLLTLPSTSPAHAAMNQAQKLERWRVLLAYL